MSTGEEACYKLFVFQGALNEGEILESFKLLGNGLCLLTDMGSDLIASSLSVLRCLCAGLSTNDWREDLPYRGCDPSKGSSLTACGINDHKCFVCHVSLGAKSRA